MMLINSKQDELLSKQGKIVKQMADDLLNRAIGERVPSMQDYASLFSASVGTVQSAANYLQTEGIISFTSRGRLGSYITGMSYAKLWQVARHRALAGTQPLPYSRQLAGLATGLRAQFADYQLSTNVRYVRGSTTRMQMLQSGETDWIITSHYAADSAHVHGFDLDIALALGRNSYTVNRVLLIRDELPSVLQDGMRIGIDVNSADHAYLVRTLSRQHAITFVEIEYQRGIELLKADEIDVAVWTENDLSSSGFHVIEIDKQYEWLAPLSEAVILTRPDDIAVKNVLNEVIATESVHAIQYEVVSSKRLPSY